MSATTELELKNALMQVPGATDSVSNRIVAAILASVGVGGGGGGTGTGAGFDDSYTAAQLETMRSAGTLTALSGYVASDTGAFYGASTVSTLDPFGGTVYLSESGTATLATSLTALGTGGVFDVRGYKSFSINVKNGDAANPFQLFDVSIKNGSGDFVITHSTAAQFAVGDDLLLDCTTDGTTADPTTLASTKNVLIRLDVRAVEYVRIRAAQGTATTSPALGVSWYATKE